MAKIGLSIEHYYVGYNNVLQVRGKYDDSMPVRRRIGLWQMSERYFKFAELGRSGHMDEGDINKVINVYFIEP